jgi:hypothetical protein
MPIAATSRRTARLCVALLTVTIGLSGFSGQSVAPVAATGQQDARGSDSLLRVIGETIAAP